MQKKWVTLIVTVVGVASGIAGIITLFRDSQSPTVSTTVVRASGDDSIAAGNDVRIGERETVNKHDFDDDRRQIAEAYLKVAHDSCKNLSERIASMTADSSIDFMQIQRLYPPEMHPTEVVAEHYGEQVYRDINTKLQQTMDASKLALVPLSANSIRAMTGFAVPAANSGSSKDRERQAAEFIPVRQAWLDSTNDLCRYLDSVGG
jgi:hypothetical protein